MQATRDTPESCARQILEMARLALGIERDHAAADTALHVSTPVDVLILDELGEAMRRGFVAREDVEQLIREKPARTELVLTGRGLLPLSDLADLVTEMRCEKHYFDEGVLARRGIEY